MYGKIFRTTASVLVFCGILQTVAFADMVQGRVAQAYPQSVDLVVYDPQGRPYPNTLNLKVDR